MAGFAVPTALSLATLLYADARLQLHYDVHAFKCLIAYLRADKQRSRTDTHNTFFTFEERARLSADHVFLIFEGRRWTYKEAYGNVLRYARWLKEEHNVSKNQIVAMDFMNCPQFIWLWIALWSLGAKPAFVNYNLTGRPLVHSIQKSTAKLVLVEDEVAKKLFTDEVQKELGEFASVSVFTAETERKIESLQPFKEDQAVRRGQQGTDTAILIYTSGTTGLPKPAVISWNKINRAGAFVGAHIGIKSTDVFHTPMPLYHTAAALLATMPIMFVGATMSLSRRFSPSTFWRDVRAHNASIIQYVGETLRYLLAAPPSSAERDHRVRLAFGNGLRPDVWNQAKERFGIDTIAEFYGATEGPAATWSLSRNDFSAGAVGRSGAIIRTLFRGQSEVIELDIASEAPVRDPKTGLCKRVPLGQPGELVTKLNENDINETFQGYFGNSEATNKKVLRDVMKKGDAFFRSGDLLRRNSDGMTFFVDRIGDTFRWKSENVATSEVAEVLGAHPAIGEANVYGVAIPGHDGRAGCATVVLNERKEDEGLLAQIAELGRSNLPAYARPLFLRFTPGLETTGTQKTMKHLLREQGVDPGVIGKAAPSDRVYWLRGNTYVPFKERDWESLSGGSVRL